MRLVDVLFTFENNWGRTDGPSYREAMAPLKIELERTLVESPGAFFLETLFGTIEDSLVLARFPDGEPSFDELHRINHRLRQSTSRRSGDHSFVRKKFRLPEISGGDG